MAGLDNLMLNDGSQQYYSEGFRVVLEDHMTYLRKSATTTTMAVSPGDAYRFQYDLYGFLSKYAVPVHLHWLVMRLNKMTSPEQFGPDFDRLLVPDQSIVSQLLQSHNASRRIS